MTRDNEPMTMSALTLRAMSRAAQRLGLDAVALLAQSGVEAEVLDDREARVPEGVGARYWSAIERVSGDCNIGLRVAQTLELGALEVIDYACKSAATLGHALDLLLQYGRGLADSLSFGVSHDRDATRLRVDVPAERRQSAEAALGLMLMRARQLSGVDGLTPLEVHFRHARPGDIRLHGEIFRAPVRFMQPHDELVIDRSALELPIPTHDPVLYEILVSHARTSLVGERPRADGVVARLRRVLEEGLRTREVDLQTLARKVHLSPRTLQRRLAEEGTSHQSLIDSVRREMALRLLESDVPIAEAAYLLGFSEASAFHRAFKRWTGQTPAEFRRSRGA